MIYVAGASGTLGQKLCSALMKNGVRFKIISRHTLYADSFSKIIPVSDKTKESDVTDSLFYLGIPPQPRWRGTWQKHFEDVRACLSIANRARIRLIYASTLSAHSANKSTYSQEKIRLEELVLASGGSVVRFGILESNDKRSAYQKLIRAFPLIHLSRIAHSHARYFITTRKEIQDLVDAITMKGELVKTPSSLSCANSVPLKLEQIFTAPRGSKMLSSRRRDQRLLMKVTRTSLTAQALLWAHMSPFRPFVDPWVSVHFGMSLERESSL